MIFSSLFLEVELTNELVLALIGNGSDSEIDLCDDDAEIDQLDPVVDGNFLVEEAPSLDAIPDDADQFSDGNIVTVEAPTSEATPTSSTCQKPSTSEQPSSSLTSKKATKGKSASRRKVWR